MGERTEMLIAFDRSIGTHENDAADAHPCTNECKPELGESASSKTVSMSGHLSGSTNLLGSRTELRSVAVLMNSTRVSTKDKKVPITRAKNNVLSKGVVRILCQIISVEAADAFATDPLAMSTHPSDLLRRARSGRHHHGGTTSYTTADAAAPNARLSAMVASCPAVELGRVRSRSAGLR